MPVHSKIQIYTFTFSDNQFFTSQDDCSGQYVDLPRELDYKHGRYSKRSVSPILVVIKEVIEVIVTYYVHSLVYCYFL